MYCYSTRATLSPVRDALGKEGTGTTGGTGPTQHAKLDQHA